MQEGKNRAEASGYDDDDEYGAGENPYELSQIPVQSKTTPTSSGPDAWGI